MPQKLEFDPAIGWRELDRVIDEICDSLEKKIVIAADAYVSVASTSK